MIIRLKKAFQCFFSGNLMYRESRVNGESGNMDTPQATSSAFGTNFSSVISQTSSHLNGSSFVVEFPTKFYAFPETIPSLPYKPQRGWRLLVRPEVADPHLEPLLYFLGNCLSNSFICKRTPPFDKDLLVPPYVYIAFLSPTARACDWVFDISLKVRGLRESLVVIDPLSSALHRARLHSKMGGHPPSICF